MAIHSQPLPASLRRDERGASVIEFGLLAPVLALLVVGISDISMGYSAKLTLEQAAYRALEKVAVGTVQPDYNYLKAEAASAAGVPVSAVTVDNWLECNRVRQASFTGVCPNGQMISRYVSIEINWTYDPSFSYGPLARSLGGANGMVPIRANAALRIQ